MIHMGPANGPAWGRAKGPAWGRARAPHRGAGPGPGQGPGLGARPGPYSPKYWVGSFVHSFIRSNQCARVVRPDQTPTSP